MTPPLPPIAVIIPAFQAEDHLAECLTSVLAQDLPAAEVVVVDDGSSDGTAEVAGRFGDAVTVIRQAQNRGVAAARNTGLAAVGCDLIAMHDADDVMRPGRLRVAAELLVADRSAALLIARMQSFTTDGSPVPAWAADEDGSSTRHAVGPVTAWSATFGALDGYDESFAIGSDMDLVLRAKAAGMQVSLTDEVLVDRRVHGGNLTRRGDQGVQVTRALREVLAERRRVAAAGAEGTDAEDAAR